MKAKIFTYVTVALTALLIVLQFLPFWQSAGQSWSIQQYIWGPSDFPELVDYIESAIGHSYTINDIVAMPFMVLVFGVIVGIICSIFPQYGALKVFQAAVGAIGAWGYLTNVQYQLGGIWVLHLAVCFAIIATSVVAAVFCFKEA